MLISFSLTGHYASFQAFGLLLWNISNHTLMTMSVTEIIYSVLFKGKGLWHFNTRACGQIPILHCKMGIWVVVEVIQCFKWFSLSFPLYWWWYIFRVLINLKLQLVPQLVPLILFNWKHASKVSLIVHCVKLKSVGLIWLVNLNKPFNPLT